jgi:heptosyltransferase I
MPERSGPRILLIRLSAIGDVVVTTPVSRALRVAMPDAHVTWVVESKAKDVLGGNPYLDDVIVWDRPKGALTPAAMSELHGLLRREHFDWAIDFQGLLRSALVARISGARRIIGNSGAKEHADMLYHVRVKRNPKEPSSRQRCLDLLRPLGVESTDRRMVVEISESEDARAREVLAENGVSDETPYVCFVPATTWMQKHWIEDHWAALARIVREELGLVQS